MGRKWTDTDDKLLLLITLRTNPNMKIDYDAIAANWPSDQEAPTKYAVQHRFRALRKETGIQGNNNDSPAVGRQAPLNTAARLSNATIARSSATTGRVKSEVNASDASASAYPGDEASASTKTSNASNAKSDASNGKMFIKREPDADPITPTPATKMGTGNKSTSNKRKRGVCNSTKRANITDASITESSDEAVSTADEDGADSPTASPKQPRVSHSRSSKTQAESFARYDGGDSSDEEHIAGADAAWSGVLKRRAKRAKNPDDDSDEDFNPDLDTSNDEGRKSRRGFRLSFQARLDAARRSG